MPKARPGEIPLACIEELATLLADILVNEVQGGALITVASRRGHTRNGGKQLKQQDNSTPPKRRGPKLPDCGTR